MWITQEIFEAFLKCPTKSYLYSANAAGIQSEFGERQQYLQEGYMETGWRRLRSNLRTDQWHLGTPPLQALEQRRFRLILDYGVMASDVRARLHALELTGPKISKVHHPYTPIRFVLAEKLATSDKLLLGFDALALSRTLGKMPRLGKIVHGLQYATVTVLLARLLGKVRSVVDTIAAQMASSTVPPLVLNRHCAECEFQARCRKLAIEKDDLSLLPNMTGKERKTHHDKGIFTITQLSYTFRARKRYDSGLKHQHALKALAIRKKQLHIVGEPAVSAPGTPVYFDVEGDPGRDFYYLIGLRIRSGGSSVQYSFWADNPSEERTMWADCLHALTAIEIPRLIHYGSYETRFLRRMRTRYGDIGNPAFLDQLVSSALNLLSVIYPHVYFPTYSNGLKEVAGYLDFRWSDSSASGLTAQAWRSQWESSHEPDLKQKLLNYNAEDCEAVEKVMEALSAVCRPKSPGEMPRTDVVNVNSLKREYPQRFGEVEFALPEFQQINEAAYWDYQRNRVYVRLNQRLQRLNRKTLNRHSRIEIRPNKITSVEEPRPNSCSRCNNPLIYKWGRFSQTVYDLRFSRTGVRRWVVRYSFPRYICWHCRVTFHRHVRKPKYGAGLCAYLLYQIIEVQIPQNAVAKSVRQLFGLPLSRGSINRIKAAAAARYEATYREILERVVTGNLVHADETRVGINGKDGYVWVFTNLEDVAFVYSETREASTAKNVLRGFRGVLVSDFYAGYDLIDCGQQKCLIHLMRDVNEDLCNQPFNEEMKEIAREFAGLVKPMIESVDRFGLKAHHLRKHRHAVDRFYDALSKQDYETEAAAGYKKRFEKNRDTLFTFLDHDGIPWNNNNAEHAIKAFVRLRNSIAGKSTAKGMRDYLVLLSICETCKCKGASFLDFLRSEEMKIDSFSI